VKTFVALNFVAGLLHYLFQVLASQRLPAESFSALSAWLAYLSFALIGAGVLQYLSCFTPLSSKRLHAFVAAGLTFALVISAAPFFLALDRPMMGVLAGVLACLLCLFLGQAQVRLFFKGMAIANVLVALSKILFIFLPLWPAAGAEPYILAVAFSYLPALILLSVVLFLYSGLGAPQTAAGPIAMAVSSTLILGAASALIPQFELMLMDNTQTAAAFNDFARLSLFYKGIFFVFLVFSQWLLPHQLRAQGSANEVLSDFRIYLAALMMAGLAALAGPLVAQNLLGWDQSPSRLQIFLSCWNMALLTWIFLLLQELCARQKSRRAAAVLGAVFAIAPLQLLLALPVEIYYSVALVWNSLLLWKVTSGAATNPGRSSPSSAA